jgi:hypothetical protein
MQANLPQHKNKKAAHAICMNGFSIEAEFGANIACLL